MQIIHFILDKILKLSTHYTPFYHYSLQSYVISNSLVFFAHPVVIYYFCFPHTPNKGCIKGGRYRPRSIEGCEGCGSNSVGATRSPASIAVTISDSKRANNCFRRVQWTTSGLTVWK